MASRTAKTSTPGVYKRGDGYCYVIRVDGKQRWVSATPQGQRFTSQKDAAKARRDALKRVDDGVDVAPDKITVREYVDVWIERQRQQIKPSTWATYNHKINKYVVPALGDMKLQKITAGTLTDFYAALFDHGGEQGEPLALGTVRYVHAIVSKALGEAEQLVYNPASKAKLPKVAHRADPMALPVASARKAAAWDRDQVNQFTEASKDHSLGLAFALALNTGLRRGELFGLRHADIERHDDGTVTLHVRQALIVIRHRLELSTPKSGKPRSFKVGTRTMELVSQRSAKQAADKLAWPGTWNNDLDLLFTDEAGRPVHPDYAGRVFRRLAKEAGLPAIRPHDMRHTYATLALQAGVPVKVVSERLGHATIAQTMDTYAHVLPKDDDLAAELFERHLYAAR